jgi:hypothetical protein
MALVEPFGRAFLSDLLRIKTGRLYPMRRDELSELGSGAIWGKELAPVLWGGQFVVNASSLADARLFDARFAALGAARSFAFSDPTYDGPVFDPGGAVVDASTVTLASIAGDRQSISLAGLPAGYVITTGDRLSVEYGATQFWMGQMAEGATANGSGATGLMAVEPAVHLGVSAGAVVRLKRPIVRMRLAKDGWPGFDAQPGFVAGTVTLKIVQRI